MQIILKNDYGEFAIGQGKGAKLISIDGLGLPQKETQTVSYAGQPGQTTLTIRDMPRTITLTFDFKGRQDDLFRLYRMIYHKIDIIIYSGDIRRKITGLCINPSDVEGIIYHRMYKTVLQFVCDDPYFHDINDIEFSINQRTDKFPNTFEDGSWYITLPAIATERTANRIIINRGIIKIYPVIEIYNNTSEEMSSPTIGISIKNHKTGHFIDINRDMNPSEKITVDLPKRKIFSDMSGDITKYISDDTVLSEFYLDVGENDIEIENKNPYQDTSAIIKYNNNYESMVI